MEYAKTRGKVRPDKGRWMIDIWADGERYKLRHMPVVGGGWLPFRDAETARDVLSMIRSAIANGATEAQAIAPYLRNNHDRFKVKSAYERFLEQKESEAGAGEIRAERVRDLRGHLRRGWLADLEGLSIHEVDYVHLEALKSKLIAKHSPRTTKHCLDDFRTFLRWLYKRQEISRVPEFPPVRVPEYFPNIPTPQQQDAMLSSIPEAQRGFFLARGYMGLRDEEAARALLEDYRLGETPDADELVVRGKGNKYRVVPVDSAVALWVRANRPVGPLIEAGVPLFPNPRTGRPWAMKSRRVVMVKAMEAAGFRGKPNECLRHCFGTRSAARLLQGGHGQGDAIRMVMSIMGHTTAESSRRYVKLATHTLRPAMQRD
jgi:integrase